MQYAQLNPNGTYLRQLPLGVPILWDGDNYCSVEALVRDGKAERFYVVELDPTDPPAFDVTAQAVERDGADFVGGRWRYKWVVIDLAPGQVAANLAALKVNSVLEIDREVDAIYLAALGNRGPEYTDAEIAAKAYVDAGYAGTVPADVQSWATAKGWTATQAADDILVAAGQLRAAKSAIRGQRLLRKEQVKAATTGAQVATAMAQWAGFVLAIKAQLGV